MSALAWLVAPSGERLPLPKGWAPTEGHRDDTWEWRLVDKFGGYMGVLDGVEEGSLDLSIYDDIRAGGSLSWSGPADQAPHWRSTLVQPVYKGILQDESVLTMPQGVFKCSTPSTGYATSDTSAQVTLYDLTLLLQRTKVRQPIGAQKGTAVVPYIRALLAEAGIARHVIEDSTATLRSTIVWDPGTAYLRVINDLLMAIGYFGIWADPIGVLRSSKRIEPKDRPLRWEFNDADGRAVHEEVIHNEDDFEVPNRVTVISRGDSYDFELIVTKTLDEIDPGNKYSQEVTGEWIDRTEEGLDATSQAVLDAHAVRLLKEGISIASTVEITAAPLPLSLHDRVSLSSTGLVIPSATIESMSITCAPGEDWGYSLREVLT